MTDNVAQAASPAPAPYLQLIDITMGLYRSRALTVAVELDIAGHLAEGPLEVDVLATKTGTHAPSLFRLLRALASIGVFQQIRPGVFGNSQVSILLQKGVPGSFWAANRMGAMITFNAWAELGSSIRSGKPSFDKVNGQNIWQFLAQKPDAAVVFDEAMRSATGPATPAVTAAYDWNKTPVIADIGGGIGTQLVSILDVHADCRGILFDKPEVLGRAIPHDRIEARAGDMFQSQDIPVGADAYILRSVIHDWPEPQALTILSNLRTAMSPDSRFILIEVLVPETENANWGVWIDLGMMVLAGGRERTATEYRELLAASGFETEQVVPTKSPFSIIVAKRTAG
jgi:hypothetical protein